MKETITHPVLGEITILKSKRARRVSISVRPTGEVRLTVPPGMSVARGKEFLEEKAGWIGKTRARLAARHPQEIISMPYSTRSHVLKLNPADVAKPSFRIRGGEIAVTYPFTNNFAEDAIQDVIKTAVEEAWRTEAKEYLPARVSELAEKFGLKIRSVAVRNTRSKWGSCSSKNDLSLSLYLMRLPDHLIDYIITHELCHVKHKNHGPRFHALLDSLCGGRHEEYRREIKKYTTRW